MKRVLRLGAVIGLILLMAVWLVVGFMADQPPANAAGPDVTISPAPAVNAPVPEVIDQYSSAYALFSNDEGGGIKRETMVSLNEYNEGQHTVHVQMFLQYCRPAACRLILTFVSVQDLSAEEAKFVGDLGGASLNAFIEGDVTVLDYSDWNRNGDYEEKVSEFVTRVPLQVFWMGRGDAPVLLPVCGYFATRPATITGSWSGQGLREFMGSMYTDFGPCLDNDDDFSDGPGVG